MAPQDLELSSVKSSHLSSLKFATRDHGNESPQKQHVRIFRADEDFPEGGQVCGRRRECRSLKVGQQGFALVSQPLRLSGPLSNIIRLVFFRYQERSLPVVPVNPNAAEVEGLKAVRDAVSLALRHLPWPTPHAHPFLD